MSYPYNPTLRGNRLPGSNPQIRAPRAHPHHPNILPNSSTIVRVTLQVTGTHPYRIDVTTTQRELRVTTREPS